MNLNELESFSHKPDDFEVSLGEKSLGHQQGFGEFEELVSDIDFSAYTGRKFGPAFKNVRKTLSERKQTLGSKRSLVPKIKLSKLFSVSKKATMVGGRNPITKVLVPNNRSLIVEGASRFITSSDPDVDSVRNIGYWNGKKLDELVLTFNNETPNDLVLSLFNPSFIVDYLHSTSQNINDSIQVAGGVVSYSDVVYNILANPPIIRNAKFVVSGSQTTAQKAVALQFQDKYINGVSEIAPLNLNLKIDVMQYEGNVINFDLSRALDNAFVPDGMQVVNYTVLAGNTVTMCFYYQQKSLKKIFYREARVKKRNIEKS